MKDLNNLGLVELNNHDLSEISGGSVILVPWGTIFKWVDRLSKAAKLYEIGSGIVDGYQDCRN